MKKITISLLFLALILCACVSCAGDTKKDSEASNNNETTNAEQNENDDGSFEKDPKILPDLPEKNFE